MLQTNVSNYVVTVQVHLHVSGEDSADAERWAQHAHEILTNELARVSCWAYEFEVDNLHPERMVINQ